MRGGLVKLIRKAQTNHIYQQEIQSQVHQISTLILKYKRIMYTAFPYKQYIDPRNSKTQKIKIMNDK